MPNSHTFTLGAWSPDRTAPVLDASGQPVGRVVQVFGWYDIDVPDINGNPVRIVGGAKIERALRRFGEFHKPGNRLTADTDPRTEVERQQDADWRDEQDTIASVRPH